MTLLLSPQMAAVVAGLARLFQPALAVPGSNHGCQGLGLWYALLGLRTVALFIADGPWSSAIPQLACNWTLVEAAIQPFCSAVCFNQHFSTAIPTTWGFSFLVGLFPVGLMRLITTGSKHQKEAAAAEADKELTYAMGVGRTVAAGFHMADQPKPAGENSSPNMSVAGSSTAQLKPRISSHCSLRSMAFILCLTLLLAVELCFFYVVIALQIPSVSETTFLCLPGVHNCPKAFECVMAGQADKQMALWALAFTAILNMGACLAHIFLRLKKASRCCRR